LQCADPDQDAQDGERNRALDDGGPDETTRPTASIQLHDRLKNRLVHNNFAITYVRERERGQKEMMPFDLAAA